MSIKGEHPLNPILPVKVPFSIMAHDVRSDEEGEELHFTSSDVDESPPPKKEGY